MDALIACLEKRPDCRTEDDLETIATNLKRLRVLKNFPEGFLEELSSNATCRNCPHGAKVLLPGQPITQWCAVLRGLLQVDCGGQRALHARSSSCTFELTEGCSFGLSCVLGARSSSQSITCAGPTDLVCVDAEPLKRIMQAYSDGLNPHLFSPESPNGGTKNGRRTSVSPNNRLLSDIGRAATLLGELMRTHEIHPLKKITLKSHSYHNSCSGTAFVDWILGLSFILPLTRPQAVGVGQSLLDQGVILECCDEKHASDNFIDNAQTYYCFHESLSTTPVKTNGRLLPSPVKTNGRLSPSSSMESEEFTLEDCLDALTHSIPDTFTKALRRMPSKRTPSDVMVIREELKNIGAFAALSSGLRDKLALAVVLEQCPPAGNYVFREGERGDAWYVILRGSVNVLQGDDIVCTLHEEHSFGKEAVTSNEPRSTSVQLREDSCLLLRVDKKSYRLALQTLHGSTFMEHGLELLLEEVESEEPLPSLSEETGSEPDEVTSDGGTESEGVGASMLSVPNITSENVTDDTDFSFRPKFKRYFSVKNGTTERILDHLVNTDRKTGMFVEDFFLTYPAFLSTSSLCAGLLARYNGRGRDEVDTVEGEGGASAAASNHKKENIVKHILLWIQVGGHELITSPEFEEFWENLQGSLSREGLFQQMADIGQVIKVYRMPVSPKPNKKGSSPSRAVKARSVDERSLFGTIKYLTLRSHQSLEHQLSIPTEPAVHAKDKDVVVVHSASAYCTVELRRDEMARDIGRMASKQLQLLDEDYHLCEVKSDGHKVVLKPGTVSVRSKLSVNGRLFLLPISTAETRKVPELVLPKQNQHSVLPFPIEADVREIAAHFVMFHWNLFLNTSQMEYLYHAFNLEGVGKVATNLDILSRRFNIVYAWVITEVCQEKDLTKRSHIVQKFIKIATHCLRFKEFNSFLAIAEALDSPAVSRLKLTWKNVPGRSRREYERLKAYTNVDRNFKKLREHIRQQTPPLVPCFPIILKDGSSIHINNKTFNGASVNFEKMRLMATSVRSAYGWSRGVLPEEVDQLCVKTPSLHYYMRNLKVIDNDQLQIEMSLEIEPRTKSV